MTRTSDPAHPAADLPTLNVPTSAAGPPAAEQPTQQNPALTGAVVEHATQMAASQLPLGRSGQAPPPLPPPPISYELRPDMLVGEYRITGRIGEGGMGAVYAAVHPLIGRKVAIKVLNASGSSADGASQRFLQEARAASLVRHRNIVDVFAFGQLQDGRSYLVMEFLEGRNLSAYLREQGALSFRQALPLIEGICAGLKAAHDRGVVHRDLKPDNIWVCTAEEALAPEVAVQQITSRTAIDALSVKLLDFGLAKLFAGAAGDDVMLTRAGMTIGTPAFMSPEQCRGDRELDHRSDIYSLGVILFQLFAGRVPFAGASYIDVMNQHLRAPPPSLEDEVGMPPDLEAVIRRALAKHAEDRFDHVAELWQALHDCDLARGWAPLLHGASMQAAEGETVRGQGQATPPAGRLPILQVEALRVEARRDGSALTLSFSGEMEGQAAALSSFLSQISETVTSAEEDVRGVVLDLQQLSFLDSDGLSCLREWLEFLAALRDEGLAPTTVRYSEAVGWQHTFVSRMRHLDPMLRAEAAD